MIELRVPRLRDGRYKPAFLERPVPSDELRSAVHAIGLSGFAADLERLTVAIAGPGVDCGNLSQLGALITDAVVQSKTAQIVPTRGSPTAAVGQAFQSVTPDEADEETTRDDAQDEIALPGSFGKPLAIQDRSLLQFRLGGAGDSRQLDVDRLAGE